MSARRQRKAVLVAPSRQLEHRRQGADSAAEIAAGLRAVGWSIQFLRSRGAWRPGLIALLAGRVDLVVAVVAGERRRDRTSLWFAALLARWEKVPLLVTEHPDGTLADLRRGPTTRRLTDRVVTRVVAVPVSGACVLSPDLLTAVGLGSARPTGDGPAPLSLDDLDSVVRLHECSFPGSAMTLLGPRVVERYYRWQFIGDHPRPFAAGVWRNGELVGFIFGGLRHDAVSGFARRFLATVVLGAVSHPRGVRQLIGPKVVPVVRLMYRRRGPGSGSTQRAVGRDKSFGILSIAVAPDARGSGVADDLMAAAEAEAVAAGLEQMNLTVNPHNPRAIRFYERLGWQRAQDGDTWSGRMLKEL